MKHLFRFALILSSLVSCGPLLAQHVALAVAAAAADSTPADTLTAPALLSGRSAETAVATTTSGQRVTLQQQARISAIVPRRATIRSLMLPGLGQIYNRQYWKVPVIYAGLGVAVGFFSWNQQLYTQYLTGYREACGSAAVNPLFGTKTAVVGGTIRTVDYLKRATEQYGRQRDLTVILTVAGWLLNAVEANVAAHLMTFDISDDLSIRVKPDLLSGAGTGVVPGLRVSIAPGR